MRSLTLMAVAVTALAAGAACARPADTRADAAAVSSTASAGPANSTAAATPTPASDAAPAAAPAPVSAAAETAPAAPAPAVPAKPFAPAARFASPQQPYASPDGQVHLLRPITSQVSSSETPVGALMSQGWRLVWDASKPMPGRVVVRLALPVAPDAPQTRRTEYLQVGVSRDAAAVRSCLTYGLTGPNAAHKPDRVINGRRYSVWSNSDAGMSQQISATDLRAVVNGACYAVERFSYGDTASERDPSITLSQSDGAAMMDRALDSLQLGPVAPGAVKQPPTVKLPRGAVAY